jgi:hypothetical protein
MIRDPGFHCWRQANRLMDAGEFIVTRALTP